MAGAAPCVAPCEAVVEKLVEDLARALHGSQAQCSWRPELIDDSDDMPARVAFQLRLSVPAMGDGGPCWHTMLTEVQAVHRIDARTIAKQVNSGPNSTVAAATEPQTSWGPPGSW